VDPEKAAAPELPVPQTTGLLSRLFELTLKALTSWVGLLGAYVGAVFVIFKNFKDVNEALKQVWPTAAPWLGIALVFSLPLLAFALHTIPSWIEQWRIRQYSQLGGASQPGYFTLRPRESEGGFERADNAHEEVSHWIENTQERVLYLTGASGTGKSSLLSAWVIPRLRRQNHVVIQLRGYEDLSVRIRDEIRRPGVIWNRPPATEDDLNYLLDRASQHLSGRHLFIVIDQFEEFLIFDDQDVASRDKQVAFKQLLSGQTIGQTFLLVYRPEYEGLIQEQSWPALRLDTNRRVVSPFTEKAAREFLGKSGVTVDRTLMRSVLREAAEIERGTVGLIRPVTVNMCGLVLNRFSNGLPRKFRGGLIRGFLRESLSLPEVRDVAPNVLTQLITPNVTKRPRTITELSHSKAVEQAAVRACLYRLGDSDRGIVRPLDLRQENWEISHDFLVPLLDAMLARRTISMWRRCRPWLPWAAAGILGITAVVIPLARDRDPRLVFIDEGWLVRESNGSLELNKLINDVDLIDSVARLAKLPQFTLDLSHGSVTDVSPVRELKNITSLNLSFTGVTDIPPLREMKNLASLNLSFTGVTDISPLREMKNLTSLYLNNMRITDISPLREMKNLTTLDLSNTSVENISALHEMKNIGWLSLYNTNVTDISPLREMKNINWLDLGSTRVENISALREMKNMGWLSLYNTNVTRISPLGEMKNLTWLDLSNTLVENISALREMKSLTALYLRETRVNNILPLHDLNLTSLDLRGTRVTDLLPLREMEKLRLKH
jgi:Leucine-rich repeat (LRR) protein